MADRSTVLKTHEIIGKYYCLGGDKRQPLCTSKYMNEYTQGSKKIMRSQISILIINVWIQSAGVAFHAQEIFQLKP
jgi:hypothetical protein